MGVRVAVAVGGGLFVMIHTLSIQKVTGPVPVTAVCQERPVTAVKAWARDTIEVGELQPWVKEP